MATRSDVVTTARKYLNVPWAANKRDGKYLDCGGLLLRVAWDLGLEAEDAFENHAGRIPRGREFSKAILSQTVRSATPGVLKPGNILIFQLGGSVLHTGIYSENAKGEPHLIHSKIGNKVLEERFTQQNHDAVSHVQDFKGIAD